MKNLGTDDREITMNYWKLIFWGALVLLVSAGIVWLYITVATTLDQQPDSFDREGGILGQVIGSSWR